MAEKKGQPKAARKRAQYKIAPEDFVVAWQQSSNADEVAAKLNMPKANVLARASTYRGKGVKLKAMPRSAPKKLDVEKLNELAGTGLNLELGPEGEE